MRALRKERPTTRNSKEGRRYVRYKAAQEADEAKAREEATLRKRRMTPAAKGGMQFVASAKRYGRHGSLTNPDDLVEETPMGGALVDYGTLSTPRVTSTRRRPSARPPRAASPAVGCRILGVLFSPSPLPLA